MRPGARDEVMVPDFIAKLRKTRCNQQLQMNRFHDIKPDNLDLLWLN